MILSFYRKIMGSSGLRDGKREKFRRYKRLTPEEIKMIQALVQSGLSLRKVAKQTDISYSTVYRHAVRFSKRQMRIDFSVFTERELGYIVGFFAGDGSRIAEKRSGHYGAKFCFDAKRDVEVASFLRGLFEKSGKPAALYREDTWLVMKVYSKRLLDFLYRFVRYAKYEGRTCKVLVDVVSWSRDFMLGFVGGLIDADGHIHQNKRKIGHFGADITTTNPSFAEQVVNLLNRLCLKPKVSKIKPCQTAFSKRTTYVIRLHKAEFCKVCRDLICIKHEQCSCETQSF
jgi:hypothetical protein